MKINISKFRNEHPGHAQLVLAMDQELDQREAAAIARHLEGCGLCRARSEQLRRVSEQIAGCHDALQSGWLRVPSGARSFGFAGVAAAMVCAALLLSVPSVRRSANAANTSVRATQDYSNIVELPFSDRALPLEDSTVVRVELPIEELRFIGLAVDGGRAGTVAQADVLMGIDGLPRAIRLVQ